MTKATVTRGLGAALVVALLWLVVVHDDPTLVGLGVLAVGVVLLVLRRRERPVPDTAVLVLGLLNIVVGAALVLDLSLQVLAGGVLLVLVGVAALQHERRNGVGPGGGLLPPSPS